jgi:hypothetical protein
MQKKVIFFMVTALSLLLSLSTSAQADDAIALVRQAIVELTDAPALGARPTVDPMKEWGADLTQINKATALLQEARNLAGGGSPKSMRLLEEAIAYGQAKLHKEARLSAQGAFAALCKGVTSEGCDKAPKFGAYVAP